MGEVLRDCAVLTIPTSIYYMLTGKIVSFETLALILLLMRSYK